LLRTVSILISLGQEFVSAQHIAHVTPNMNNATKGRRGGAKKGSVTRRRSSRLCGPASSATSSDQPPTSAANAFAQLISPTSAKAKGRRTKRKTSDSASTSAASSAAQVGGNAQTVVHSSKPSTNLTSKRRKSSSASGATSAPSAATTEKRRTTRSRQKQREQRGRKRRDQQLYVTPSPVGPVPEGICPSSAAIASEPTSPGSDHSPIEGATIKEALRAESVHGDTTNGYASPDMMTPTSPDGGAIKQGEEEGKPRPPAGVVDLDALAFHHLTLRTNPHPYVPAEPYYVDTTNSFLAQYGSEYHKHLADTAQRHHRALSTAPGNGPTTPNSGPAAVSCGASVTSHGSGGSNASDAVLPNQSEISVVMRGILVDWLAELKHSFKLNDITLHLSVKVMDRVISIWDLERKMFQCLGCACMLIASKLEETQPVTIKDLAYMTDGTYTSDQIKEMEAKVCDLLQFCLQSSTPYQFIDRFLRASDATAGLLSPSPRNPIQEQMVLYLTELSLMKSEFMETPSCLITAAAVYLARATLGIRDVDGNIWSKTLEYYTGYSVRDLEHTVRTLHESQRDSRESDLQCCVEPYRRKERYCVASKPAVQPCDLGFDS